MLRATRQLLKPGGRTAFLTIHQAPGLTGRRRRRASGAGPVAVLTARTHNELLEAAGFVDVRVEDRTDEFAQTTRAWLVESVSRADGLRTVLGDAVFDERQADRTAQLRAIEDGLLQRSLVTARRAVGRG